MHFVYIYENNSICFNLQQQYAETNMQKFDDAFTYNPKYYDIRYDIIGKISETQHM